MTGRALTAAALAFAMLSCAGEGVTLTSGAPLTVSVEADGGGVVETALEIFSSDYGRVFGGEVVRGEDATLVIETADGGMPEEGYAIDVTDGKILVRGNDSRGTAYALMELSRMMGVSPWEWWADSPVEPKAELKLREGLHTQGHPSVRRRGIFINDEDWGLTPWSWQTHEPSDVEGEIGPKTHARIFELLLRLKANTFWPAMHACSRAFYVTPGNKEMADRYGIYIGSSHCEPMVRNTNAEWRTAGVGEYNYVSNRENVLRFWEERVELLANSDNIYTLGIRGIHDSKMLGAETVEEQLDVLTRVIRDQREMIARHVNPDVEKVSQVLIPYKEVLEVYNAGLEVPDDVTLMWCDDNYGYIRHFPTAEENARSGGGGVYYHVSYWGRPHDYLWLATTHPGLVFSQMKMAYDKGAREMWILNVGDIKPAEYLTELFLDMAWDINGIRPDAAGLDAHLHAWLSREFGSDMADELLPVMNEFYRLAYIHKPEFMGGTRTEEKDPAYKIVSDLPWCREVIEERIADYKSIADRVAALSERVPDERAAAWYELVEYPVLASAEMNKKLLFAQLARHGLADWRLSDEAYDSIVRMTERYNALCGGKWDRIMSSEPRRLPVFGRVEHRVADAALPERQVPLALLDGNDYASFDGDVPVCYGLGYGRGAIHISKGTSVTYAISPAASADSLTVEVALTPCHPVSGGQLRYAVAVADEAAQTVDYHTEGRSEEWKVNVLFGRAIRSTRHKGGDSLTITAVDEGVVVDQIKVLPAK